MLLALHGRSIGFRTINRKQLALHIKQLKSGISSKINYCIPTPLAQRYFHMDQNNTTGMQLQEVVSKLNEFAPLSLAESWDNVGLLIEPFTERDITKILLTNDLTEAVMQEVLEKKAEMIISYHPPIFSPLKSVCRKTWKERIVAACLENRIALYSPHTSFDAVKGGVNDWLASAFDAESISPLTSSTQDVESNSYLAELICQHQRNEENAELDVSKIQVQGGNAQCLVHSIDPLPSGDMKMSLKLSPSMLPQFMKFFKISDKTKVTLPECGIGRMCYLKSPHSVSTIVEMVKKHIKIPRLRLALAVGKNKDSSVSTIAICAGSGASVLRNVKADLYLTGEMSHHEVLDATHRGSHVILCEHSNSERGFLTYFADILGKTLLNGKVQVVVSSIDADPLVVV